MTIEFSCSHCNKVLKTSDDKAGRRAKCPQCGEPIDVPMPADATNSDDGFGGFGESPVSEEQSFLADYPVSEEHSFLNQGTIDCPMCGASVRAGTTKCEACGETLQTSGKSGGRWEPRVFSIGEVFSRTWEVYKANLGMAIGVPLLAGGIYFVGSIAIGIVSALLSVALVSMVGGGDMAQLVQIPIVLVQNILVYGILFYVQLGGQLTFLKIVRGENPELNVMFSCGPFLGRMFLCSIIYGILTFLGLLLLIIPGIIVGLMFWPYSFILVDRNLPGIDSFSESRKVSSGNLLNLFGLSILLGLITILGAVVTLGIGLIFIIPFTYMAQTVAYAEMTNQ